MAIGLGRLVKRYSLVTLLPTFVVGSIYADYSYTQEWKRTIREGRKAAEV